MSDFEAYGDGDTDGVPGLDGDTASLDDCCGPSTTSTGTVDFDTDGDGLVDQSAIDTNGDGLADTWNIDTNRDLIADQVAFDTDGDGMADAWNIDADQDGIADSIRFDADRDGAADPNGGWSSPTPASDPFAAAPEPAAQPGDGGGFSSGDDTLDSILERAERTTDPDEKERLLDFARTYSQTMADMARVWTI